MLGVQDNVTECATLCTPAAVTEIASGEFAALLVITILPVTVTAAEGLNATTSTATCPGERARPGETPEALNPVPETVTPEKGTFPFPVLVIITF